MPVEDVFTISGRGTVVTGRVERGIVKVGEEVEIVGFRDTTKTVVTGVEMFRKLLDQGQAGDNIGALLRGTEAEDIERGQVLRQAGLDHAAQEVQGRGLRPEEGRGRAPHAVLQQLPPAVLLPHDGRHRHVKLPEGVEMVMPGDNINIDVELHHADRVRRGPALRHPRRRPHRRRRRRHQDPRVTSSLSNAAQSVEVKRSGHGTWKARLVTLECRTAKSATTHEQEQADDAGQAGVLQVLLRAAGSTRTTRRRSNRRPTLAEHARQDPTLKASTAMAVSRPVALIGRAADSKSAGWGFESLLACICAYRRSRRRERLQVEAPESWTEEVRPCDVRGRRHPGGVPGCSPSAATGPGAISASRTSSSSAWRRVRHRRRRGRRRLDATNRSSRSRTRSQRAARR